MTRPQEGKKKRLGGGRKRKGTKKINAVSRFEVPSIVIDGEIRGRKREGRKREGEEDGTPELLVPITQVLFKIPGRIFLPSSSFHLGREGGMMGNGESEKRISGCQKRRRTADK